MNTNQRKTKVATLMLEQTSEQRKSPEEEAHYIMMNIPIHQEDIAIINTHARTTEL
jgi:hypothetical protein